MIKLLKEHPDIIDTCKKLLEDFTKITLDEVIKCYEEPHRYYHTFEHIETMLIEAKRNNWLNDGCLVLAILFHDIVYVPGAQYNEFQSQQFLYKHCLKKNNVILTTAEYINDTRDHKDTKSKINILDLDIFNQNMETLIDYEHKIFKEFQMVDLQEYIKGREIVLRKYITPSNSSNIENLITYVKHRKYNIGVYPGSFEPFHIGHLNILQKAEKVFDKVIIARGKNINKELVYNYTFPTKLDFYQKINYQTDLVSFIQKFTYPVTIIRGIRDSKDLVNETATANVIKDYFPEVQFVHFICDKEYDYISSSMIRELEHWKKDTSYYCVT